MLIRIFAVSISYPLQNLFFLFLVASLLFQFKGGSPLDFQTDLVGRIVIMLCYKRGFINLQYFPLSFFT